MKIEIAPPCAIHDVGQRTNNEDYLFPPFLSANQNNRLFLVCDGVGGTDKGEVASEITCCAIAEYFERNRLFTSNEQTVFDAIAFAKAEIDQYLNLNPGSEGMATTLTFLHLHENGATIAHIGDSRVYHIRNGEIIWKTQDHSYVNDLVKAGVITDTEALSHPRRNVIMRALQGGEGDIKADVHSISDLQQGDFFFLCSDGIMEGIDENEMTEILHAVASDKSKMSMIQKRCKEKSSDNFTAYLVRIQKVENLTIQLIDETEKKINRKKIVEEKNFLSWSWTWIFVLLLVAGGWYFYSNHKLPAKPIHKPVSQVVQKDSVSAEIPPGKHMKVKKKNKSKNGKISR